MGDNRIERNKSRQDRYIAGFNYFVSRETIISVPFVSYFLVAISREKIELNFWFKPCPSFLY